MGEGLGKYVMVKKKSYVEKGERIKIVDENRKMGNSVMWKWQPDRIRKMPKKIRGKETILIS